jgi:hypothetical protein
MAARTEIPGCLSLWPLVCCPRWPHTDPGSMHLVGQMTSAYAPLVYSQKNDTTGASMHATGKIRGSMHQVRILDAQALQAVLARVLKHHPSHARASAFLGIGQTTFTRLLNGTTNKTMSFDSYSRIRSALSRDMLEFDLLGDFDDAMLRWESAQVLGNYQSWLRRELEELGPKAAKMFTRLFDDPKYRDHFETFLEAVRFRRQLPPLDDERAWLALYRAVGRLCDSETTWGVERSLEEIEKAGDLDGFLRASLRCERILIMRGRDFERAKWIGAPAGLFESLAEED